MWLMGEDAGTVGPEADGYCGLTLRSMADCNKHPGENLLEQQSVTLCILMRILDDFLLWRECFKDKPMTISWTLTSMKND